MLLLFLPLSALADGMVIPTVAYPAKITIPDQRALICFSNGTERLVIETRFTGAGTNFAWVVPLPSQSVIEEATTGLFPTLQYLFRPEFIHDVPRYYPWIFALAWLVYVLLFVRPTGRLSLLDITGCLLAGLGVATIGGMGEFPWGFWTVIGFIVFLDLIFILTLVRLWNCLPRALGVAMLPVFLAPQFLLLTITAAPESLPLFFGVLFILVLLDRILTVSLIKSWKNVSRAIATVMLICLLAFQVFLFVFLWSVQSRSSEMRSMETLGMDSPPTPSPAVSILDRKIVGVFETTTITSHDAKALQAWLSQNGFTVPTNAEPVIASYVKDGWVFVATKVRRDKPDNETSTPHPLSFTFKTDKPVYPMRLTGLNSQSLMVDLYVFSDARAAVSQFKVESCSQPDIAHPLLRRWTTGLPIATKLAATLSPADMRKDIWINWTSFSEKKDRLFSQQAALTMALNWGAGVFTACLLAFCLLALASKTLKTKLLLLIGFVTIASGILAGLIYRSLPKTEVIFVKEHRNSSFEGLKILHMILHKGGWQTTAEARAKLQEAISNPINSQKYYSIFSPNDLVGGQVHEEDSPGNYLLRETNQQVQLIIFDANGGEHVLGSWDLPAQHQAP